MQLHDPTLTFGLALAAGMVAQVIARHLRIPGIVLLLLVGVLLGPDVANVVRPQTLGGGLRIIIAAAVAVILFEGGLHLDLARLRGEAPTIRRLVLLGPILTGIPASVAARWIMNWPWEVAIPFGALVVVTGPTVIGPLLRRIRVQRNLHTILEAEGVLIDPIGAILAVVALEVVLAQEFSSAAQGLLGVPIRVLFGTAAGAAGGLLMGKLLASERLIPDGLESITILSLLLALYAACEAVLPESGIMAAPIAGVVVGNMPLRPSRELKEFKQQLSVLLVGLLFVLLAADVRVGEVTGLGWRGWATVAVLMLLVRPFDIAVSTANSSLTLRERAFLSWLGPRGIVAAAVASLFADHLVREGIGEGLELRALVFLVIALTVVVQGLSGNFIAGLLGVRRRSDTGYVIAGAHPLARAVAVALRHAGEDVVLVDTDAAQVAAAERSGLSAIHGNVLDDDILEQVDLEGRRGIIGLIPNEAVTLFLAQKARREYRVATAHVAVRNIGAEVSPGQLQLVATRLLFGMPVDLDFWSRQLTTGSTELRVYLYIGNIERAITDYLGDGPAGDTRPLFLAIQRRGRATPVDANARFRRGDIVYVLADGPGAPPADFESLEVVSAAPR